MVDTDTSAEKFIKNLTSKCTYIVTEDVLPKILCFTQIYRA